MGGPDYSTGGLLAEAPNCGRAPGSLAGRAKGSREQATRPRESAGQFPGAPGLIVTSKLAFPARGPATPLRVGTHRPQGRATHSCADRFA